jgi:hypothetical protein
MLVSSMTSRSQSSEFSTLRLKPPVLELISRSRWIVFASCPVVSVMRLAARPVGAHKRRQTFFGTFDPQLGENAWAECAKLVFELRYNPAFGKTLNGLPRGP